ncbi:MAG: hypothetical protein QM756_38620 [Polyangiaceae bacterium]
MTTGRSGTLISRIALALSLLLIGGGAWLAFGNGQADEAERVAQLQSMQASAIESTPPGAPLLLGGRLVAREAIGPEGFVVYTKESYLRTETQGATKDRQQWLTLSVPTPLIALEAGGVTVPICNRSYAVANPLHRWQSDVIPTWRSVGDATIRLSGFKAGDSLTVDGRVTSARCVEAKTVFGGTASEYRDYVRHGIVVFRVVGGVFAALGAVALAIGIAISVRKAARGRDRRAT